MLCMGPGRNEERCAHGYTSGHQVAPPRPSRPPGWGTVAGMPRAASTEPVTAFIPPPRPDARPCSYFDEWAYDSLCVQCRRPREDHVRQGEPEAPSTPLHVNALAFLGSAGIVVGLVWLALRASGAFGG